MVQIITNYWLEFLLGSIATGLTFACKKIWSLYQTEKKRQKTEEQKAFYEALKDSIAQAARESIQGDAVLQEQIDVMKRGILSIQRKHFKQECRDMLDENYKVTLVEFESFQEDYKAYKQLGGNSDGDALYNMVCQKVQNVLAEGK